MSTIKSTFYVIMYKNEMKFHMRMFMNAWMMLVLKKCRCQMQILTLGCYTFLGSCMIGFLRSRFRRYLRKEGLLNRYFYSEFDLTILEEQRARHRYSEQNRGEPSTSGLKDPMEEPVKEMTLDLEDYRYSFYLRPMRGEV